MLSARKVFHFLLIFCGFDVITCLGPCTCVTSSWDCSNLNKTVILDSELCSNAVTWKLQGNKLRSLPGIASSSISSIDVSNNELGLGAIDSGSYGFMYVKSLDISKNNITDLSFLSAVSCGVTNLVASYNTINELTAIRKCAYITTLDLERNDITCLSDGAFNVNNWQYNLKSIILAGNPIASISSSAFGSLTGVKHLDIGYTRLSKLQTGLFEKMTLLENLFLNNNQLQEFPETIFKGLTRLRNLLLNDNQLSELPTSLFEGMVGLQYLYLQRNQLKTLPEEIFDDMRSLQSLDLDDNLLEEIPSRVFSRLHSLQELSVRNNRLKFLPSLCGLSLRSVLFTKNIISSLDEEAVRSLLTKGFGLGDITQNPVKSESTEWIKYRSDLKLTWKTGNVCGTLSLQGIDDHGLVQFCVIKQNSTQ